MRYFDSSAIIKQYLEEPDSDTYRLSWDFAKGICTSAVAYAETMAVMNRKRHRGDITDVHLLALIEAFHEDWGRSVIIPVSIRLDPIIDRVVARHSLRGFDALHLASAILLADSLPDDLTFVCADKLLNGVARMEGLETFDGGIQLTQHE